MLNSKKFKACMYTWVVFICHKPDHLGPGRLCRPFASREIFSASSWNTVSNAMPQSRRSAAISYIKPC